MSDYGFFEAVLLIVFILVGLVCVFIGIIMPMSVMLIKVIVDMIKGGKDNE